MHTNISQIMKDKIIKIGDSNYKTILNPRSLSLKIRKIAKRILSDYSDSEPPVLLVVTNGGMYFGACLSMFLQDLNFAHSVDTVRIKRYVSDKKTTNGVKISSEPSINLQDKNIIIIEDIVDEGITLAFLHNYLKTKNAKSIEYCVLIEKKSHIKLDFDIKYSILSNIGPEWLVGFGMDSNFLLRGLRGIYAKLD